MGLPAQITRAPKQGCCAMQINQKAYHVDFMTVHW